MKPTETGRVKERVAAAFGAVPRGPFLPRRQRRHAGEDRPLDIGYGQTNSQPRTVRAMLEALDPQPGHRVLDVGCGTGWTTALLAALVGPQGTVVGVEIIPQLAHDAARNVTDLSGPQATVIPAHPDALGASELGPYDRILTSAEARSVPEPLVDQLAPGGRMVAPVRGRLIVLDKDDEGRTEVRRLGHYLFVPLVWDPDAPTTGDAQED